MGSGPHLGRTHMGLGRAWVEVAWAHLGTGWAKQRLAQLGPCMGFNLYQRWANLGQGRAHLGQGQAHLDHAWARWD